MSRHERLKELVKAARDVVAAKQFQGSALAVLSWVDILAHAIERYDEEQDCNGAPCTCKPRVVDNKTPSPTNGC